MTTKSEMGKKSRKAGNSFELKVRHDLEDQGFTVTKWGNQVDLEKDKIIPAPHKFNFFNKSVLPGQGFPDFIAFKRKDDGAFVIYGVESKMSKYLDADEKEKCEWYKKHKIFDNIFVGFKDKSRHVAYYEYPLKRGEKGNKTIEQTMEVV